MTPDYGCKLIKGQLFFAYDTFCVQIGNKAFQGNLLVMQSYCHQLFSNMGMPLKRYRTVIGNSTRVVFSFDRPPVTSNLKTTTKVNTVATKTAVFYHRRKWNFLLQVQSLLGVFTCGLKNSTLRQKAMKHIPQ